MKKITLRIENPFERETVTVEDEITIGRTDASRVVLSDSGLSRRNTTFFRDGDALFVVDENSTNGTFLGGERLSGAPVQVSTAMSLNSAAKRGFAWKSASLCWLIRSLQFLRRRFLKQNLNQKLKQKTRNRR